MTAPAKQAHDVPRAPDGRILPGASLNPAGGGRTALPDWYKDHGPDALLGILAEATGLAVRLPWMTDEQWTILEATARDAEPAQRSAARKQMKEDIYGKAPQAVDHTGTVAVTPLADAMQRLAEQFTAPEKPDGPEQP